MDLYSYLNLKVQLKKIMNTDDKPTVGCMFDSSDDEEETHGIPFDNRHEIVEQTVLTLFIREVESLISSQRNRVIDYPVINERAKEDIKEIVNINECLRTLEESIMEIQKDLGRGDQSFTNFILEYYNRQAIYSDPKNSEWRFKVFESTYNALTDLLSRIRDLYNAVVIFTSSSKSPSQILLRSLENITYRVDDLDRSIGSTLYLIHYLDVNRK